MLRPNASAARMKWVVLILFGLASSLFIPAPLRVNSAFVKALIDLVHLPLFAAITLCFFILAHNMFGLTRARAFLVTVVMAVAFAGGSELLQGLLGRDPSWGDFANNLSAMVIALTGIRMGIAWESGERWKRWGMAFGGALALGVTLAMISPVRAATAVRRQGLRFPVLGEFEEDWELLLWRAQGELKGRQTTVARSSEHAASGTHSLELRMAAAPWAGVHLLSSNSDWSRFSALRLEVFNPGEAFELGIRLDTDDGGRFSGILALGRGTNACVLPLNQLQSSTSATAKDSLHRVARLVLHGGAASVARTLFLDDVRLE